jgi:tetratricopeptide (TPR) repeat protein
VIATHRQILTTGVLLAACMGGVDKADAQVRRAPDANTPRLLVATFRSTERGLGAESADALRTRVSQYFDIRQLLAISRQSIAETLKPSGFSIDSVLSPNDARELARMMRADQIVDGEVTKLADGSVKVSARMFLPRDGALAQPLGDIVAKNVNAAVKEVARELGEALKQLRDARECDNAMIAQQYDAAVAAARKAIALYPKASIARLCLASALSAMKRPADEVIRIADEVLALDSLNRIALGLKLAAQEEKGDVEGAVSSLLRLIAGNPTDRSLIDAIIAKLARLDPDKGVEAMQKVMVNLPGDPSLTRQYWLMLLLAARITEALDVGESLATLDTAQMDSTWFTRMTAAASTANQPEKALAYAARAVERFPNSAGFLALHAGLLRKTGQVAQAVSALQRAVAIDPKVENGYVGIVVGLADLDQADSARVWAQRAIAGGASAETIGSALIGTVRKAFEKAQQTKTRADWREALTLAQGVHDAAPSTTSNWFVGIAAFQIGVDALQRINTTRSCAEVGVIESTLAVAQPALLKGGRVDPDAAGKMLHVIGEVTTSIPQYKRAFCTTRARPEN